jgi:hypothetical protein
LECNRTCAAPVLVSGTRYLDCRAPSPINCLADFWSVQCLQPGIDLSLLEDSPHHCWVPDWPNRGNSGAAIWRPTLAREGDLDEEMMASLDMLLDHIAMEPENQQATPPGAVTECD